MGRSTQRASKQAAEWPRRIEDALARDRFALYTQPIVDIETGQVLRHELFLRMVEDDAVIPAGDFMTAAEEHGSIRDIDRWVVGAAIDVAARGYPVHVNLSVRSLDRELLALICTKLADTGARASDVTFELSERQLVDAGKEELEFVKVVSAMGCELALDQFIQGGHRYGLLRRFPLAYVKIGPPFITDLPHDTAGARMIERVAMRTHRFGEKLIAQGVEDIVTLQILQDIGVDQVQGHALGAPAPLDPATGAPA